MEQFLRVLIAKMMSSNQCLFVLAKESIVTW